MSTQLVRASRLIGSDVKDPSENRIGRIEDVLLNPTSGKIDFAVISLSPAGAASSPSGTSSGSATSSRYGNAQDSAASGANRYSGGSADNTASSSRSESSASQNYGTSSTSGRLIPVPWSLLQAQPVSADASSASATSGLRTTSFTLNIDRNKLDSAPSLGRGSW